MDYLLKHNFVEKDGFSKVYLKLRKKYLFSLSSDTVGDREKSQKINALLGIDEKTARVLWYEMNYDRRGMTTLNNRKLFVVSPGEWNLDDGPDFIGAEVKVDDVTFRGDIEIHRKYSDWRSHKHNKDKKFSDVILHVFVIDDRPKYFPGEFVFDINNRKIYQLNIGKFIYDDTSNLPDDFRGYPYVSSGGKGECAKRLSSSKYDFLFYLLKSAGDGRIILKSEKYFRKKYTKEQLEQLLYEDISEALGYRENKYPMRTLAQKLSLKTLHSLLDKYSSQERIMRLQSLLFGLSGLLPDTIEGYDSETKTYISHLKTIWNIYSNRFSQTDILKPNQWNYYRTRPLNFPARRIAGLSYLLDIFLSRGIINIFLSWSKSTIENKQFNTAPIFIIPPQGYFSCRSKFGSKPFPKPQVLIGKERALAISVNIILPFLYFFAERSTPMTDLHSKSMGVATKHSDLSKFYRALPVISENRYVKLFTHRLFGNYSRLPIKIERLHQGLLQIFTDFCDIKLVNCKKCIFPYILELSPEELP